jgi:hypothetical protein
MHSLKPMQEIKPQNSCWLQSWFPQAWTTLPEALAGNQAPGLPLPEGLVPPCLQHYCTTLLEPMPGKQVPELPLPDSLVPSHLQQLRWLQVPQCQQKSLSALAACRLGFPMPAAATVAPGSPHPMQIDSRVSAALWAPDNSSWLALLPHRYPQLATLCHKPKWTPGSRLVCWCQSTEAQPPHCPWQQESPHSSFKEQERAKKATTCYNTGGTRIPISPRYTEAHHFTLHLPAIETHLSCPRAGIPAPPLSNNLLHC